MAQIEKTAKLVRLSDTELTIANPAEDIRDRTAHHVAPGGRGWRNTYPEKAERRLNDNGHAELGRDEHQIGSHTLGGDVLQDDPEM